MIVYIATFFVSLLFLYLGSIKYNSNKVNKIFKIIGLLIPCIIAGLRAKSVGSDTNFYIWGVFNYAEKSDNLFDFISIVSMMFKQYDYIFLVFTFFVTKIFGNFNILLFFYELLIIIPIYIVLSKRNCTEKKSIVFGMFIFYMFTYNLSLSVLRQSVALSFCLLALTYYLNGEKKHKILLSLIFAVGFHITALFFVLLFLIYSLVYKSKISIDKKNAIKIIIVFFNTIIILFFSNLIEILYSLGIYKHGKVFMDTYSGFDFSFIDTFTYAFFIFLLVMNKKSLKEKYGIQYNFFLYIAINAILVLQIGAFIQYGERVSYYLIYPVIYFIISVLNSNDIKNKNLNKMLIVLFFIMYWTINYCVWNLHSTMPYVFYWS